MMKRLLSLMAIAIMLCSSRALADDITVTFNPESGSEITELSGFEATFSADMQLDGSGGFVFRDGIMVQTTVKAVIADDKRTVTFTIEPTLTAPGEYTFKYFDWLIKPVGSGYTPSIDPVYTIKPVDGIETIATDEAVPAKAYNLQGIEVKGTPTPGVTIVNGKKVLIK